MIQFENGATLPYRLSGLTAQLSMGDGRDAMPPNYMESFLHPSFHTLVGLIS